MKNIFIFLFCLCCTLSLAAQSTIQETSDPAAKAILEKMRNKYESYKAVSANFELIIEIPEEEEEVQQGFLAQEGEKYQLTLDNQAIYCDGKTLWLYLKSSNEVQINSVDDFEEEDEFLSPKDLLRIYEKEDFLYAITNDTRENGVAIQQIEFKPMDEDSEYQKMRLTINKKTLEILRVKAFSKDGARYTMKLSQFTPNPALQSADFVFDKTKFPGVYVEDLRID